MNSLYWIEHRDSKGEKREKEQQKIKDEEGEREKNNKNKITHLFLRE